MFFAIGAAVFFQFRMTIPATIFITVVLVAPQASFFSQRGVADIALALIDPVLAFIGADLVRAHLQVGAVAVIAMAMLVLIGMGFMAVPFLLVAVAVFFSATAYAL